MKEILHRLLGSRDPLVGSSEVTFLLGECLGDLALIDDYHRREARLRRLCALDHAKTLDANAELADRACSVTSALSRLIPLIGEQDRRGTEVITRVKGRSLPLLEVRDISIGQLVPGELFLEADVVDRVRTEISKGFAIDHPRVTPMGGLFYVCDGNHRVMAMKLLGKSSIQCRIQPHISSPNVADYKADKFEEAVRGGYTGFVGVQMGSAEEKALAYEAEDELFDDAILEGLNLDFESSKQIGENEEEDFFGDNKEQS